MHVLHLEYIVLQHDLQEVACNGKQHNDCHDLEPLVPLDSTVTSRLHLDHPAGNPSKHEAPPLHHDHCGFGQAGHGAPPQALHAPSKVADVILSSVVHLGAHEVVSTDHGLGSVQPTSQPPFANRMSKNRTRIQLIITPRVTSMIMAVRYLIVIGWYMWH